LSIFQNVDWVALLVVVVGLVVIFAIVNVRLRLSLLRREAKQLSQDVMRLTTWAEDRRLNQLDSATKKRRTNTSCSLTSIAVLHHSRLTAMRKFLGPEGELEALRTFDYPNQNADRRHRCARFVNDDYSLANVGDWIVRHPDGTLSVTAAANFARYYRPARLRMA